MLMDPLPHPAIFRSRKFDLHKHNRRLGKVSHHMKKIIEDIQGNRFGDVESCRSRSDKSPCRTLESEYAFHIQRKGVEISDQDAEYQKERLHRRKSRKHREDDLEGRKAKCDHQVTESKLHKRIHKLSTEQRQESNTLHTCSYCLPNRGLKETSNTDKFCKENYQKNCGNCFKSDKCGGETAIPPWKRPLPPIPGKPTTVPSTGLREKVLDTDSLEFPAKYNPRHGNIKPGVGVCSHEYLEDCADIVTSSPVSKDYYWTDCHIYESISEANDCEKTGQLVPPPAYTDFTFRHNETYLEPVRCLQQSGFNKQALNFNFQYRSAQYRDQITEITDYSRDYWGSPASSTSPDLPGRLKATFV